MKNNFLVFNKKIAEQLIREGFNMVNTAVNREDNTKLVFYFDDSAEVRNRVAELSNQANVNQEKSMQTKEIYSRRIAYELRKRGFIILRVEVNQYKPNLNVFIFEETEAFNAALTEVMLASK